MKRQIALIALIAVGLVSCGKSQPPPPQFTPTNIRSLPVIPSKPQEGSIYDPNSNQGLFQDFRARKVGDVITILIEEDLRGQKNVQTNTDRQHETSKNISGIFGTEIKGLLSPAGAAVGDAVFSTASKDTFKGTGKTSSDANLRGTISARVVEVLPDGNLLVEGTRELKINNDSQYLILSGIVRPKDIRADNTISSTKLADARITYTGGGSVTDKTNPGLFSKLLNLFLPF